MNRGKKIGISVLIPSLFLFILIGVIIAVPKPLQHIVIRSDLTTNDMYYYSYMDSRPDITTNSEFINIGHFNNDSIFTSKGMFKFSLTIRPTNYNSCVIPFYIFNVFESALTEKPI